MSNNDAKLHLSIQDGIFEISGSELFVSQQIENFKEIILEALKNSKAHNAKPIQPNQDTTSNTGATEKLNEPENQKLSFPRVLDINGENVRIIKRMPGQNNAKKTINTALAYLWGKRSAGVTGVTYQEIRDLCQEQACLDSSNFSSTMKGAIELIIIDGKKGSTNQICRLTIPGVEAAEELLGGLNGE